jgi:hypothetical protein
MPWYNILNIGLLTIIWCLIAINIKAIISARKHWLLFFLLYSATEYISVYFSFMAQSNLWLYSVSKPIQYLFVFSYFLKILNIAKQKQRIVLILSFSVYALLLVYKDLDSYNSLELVVSEAIIVFLCVMYFKKIIELNDGPMSEFWFCSSLFVWFGSNLWINGAMDFFLKDNIKIAQRLFYGLVITSYIFYLIIIYALVIQFQKSKKQQNG